MLLYSNIASSLQLPYLCNQLTQLKTILQKEMILFLPVPHKINL